MAGEKCLLFRSERLCAFVGVDRPAFKHVTRQGFVHVHATVIFERDQLVLHADNGSPMKDATMLGKLQELGVVPSFSRSSVSNDNPYAEVAFRTLTYVPSYPGKPFHDIGEARHWVQRFVVWYNTEHRHSGIRFVTPQQRHDGEDRVLLKARTSVYKAAKQTHPDRLRGRAVRNWMPIGQVWLNPDKSADDLSQNMPLTA